VPAAGLNLVAGINRLSVEVHQQIATGNDMVCGVRLSLATILSPEIPPAPVTSNPEEWIELHNRGQSTIDLGGWALADAVSFTLPPGTSLAPGAYLVVANDSATLKSKWPERAAVIVGDFAAAWPTAANGSSCATPVATRPMKPATCPAPAATAAAPAWNSRPPQRQQPAGRLDRQRRIGQKRMAVVHLARHRHPAVRADHVERTPPRHARRR
jgi:hypothetical protein